MFFRLFLLFTAIPLLELLILIDLGSWIGAAPTLGLVILTGAAGAWIARLQGLSVLGRIQQELAEGRLPALELVDGALVLVGGILLLTPGLLTDLMGLSLMVPACRALVRGWLLARLEGLIREGKVHVYFHG
ncbi:MAG: FxsA family protein [Candidatus Tectomicrobia bacterium]|nr:FxsA family protein [Candidatus Tectomicrobia bacterium]